MINFKTTLEWPRDAPHIHHQPLTLLKSLIQKKIRPLTSEITGLIPFIILIAAKHLEQTFDRQMPKQA